MTKEVLAVLKLFEEGPDDPNLSVIKEAYKRIAVQVAELGAAKPGTVYVLGELLAQRNELLEKYKK